MANKRYWFHCTTENVGRTLEIAKRPPLIRGAYEPLTPRICVAPSVIHCLTAIIAPRNATIHVYRTRKPRTAYYAKSIWDAPVTREHWLWPPGSLEYFAKIPSELVEPAYSIARAELRAKGGANIRQRVAHLIRVSDALQAIYPNATAARVADGFRAEGWAQ